LVPGFTSKYNITKLIYYEEESKKGFAIDIEEVAERVDGRMALLGNVDAIGLMEHGSDEELRAEIARQLGVSTSTISQILLRRLKTQST
jgi:Fic family protein